MELSKPLIPTCAAWQEAQAIGDAMYSDPDPVPAPFPSEEAEAVIEPTLSLRANYALLGSGYLEARVSSTSQLALSASMHSKGVATCARAGQILRVVKDVIRPQPVHIQQISRLSSKFEAGGAGSSFQRLVSQIAAPHCGIGADVDRAVEKLLVRDDLEDHLGHVDIEVSNLISGQLTYTTEIGVTRKSDDGVSHGRRTLNLPGFVTPGSGGFQVGSFVLDRLGLLKSRLKTESRPLPFLIHTFGDTTLARRTILPIVKTIGECVQFKLPSDSDRLTMLFHGVLTTFANKFPHGVDANPTAEGIQFACLQIMPKGIDFVDQEYTKETHPLAIRISVFSSPTCPVAELPLHAKEIANILSAVRELFVTELKSELHLFDTLVRPYPSDRGAYIDISPGSIRDPRVALMYAQAPAELLQVCHKRDVGIPDTNGISAK